MKEIILNTSYKASANYRKFVALVDDEDYERVSKYKWFIQKQKNITYVGTLINHRPLLMHRFILNAKQGQMIDHISGDGLDNQKKNLRLCSSSQNLRNKTGWRNSRSKYKGIYLHKPSNKWQAQIYFNKKSYNLGCFCDEKDAARAYNAKAKEVFGEFARLNII